MGRLNDLDKVEQQVATEIAEKRKKRKRYRTGDQTRIAVEVRKGNRMPPPVPKNKSLKEIHDMDPDHRSLKAEDGRGRPREHFIKDTLQIKPDLSFRDSIRADQQRRTNERRGRIRKWEAEVVKAQEVLSVGTKSKDHALDIYDEERAIAEGILTLDDWDNEELIRGYRRGRGGKFGKAPQYIPREIQQEAFRRLVHRGNRKLREAYIHSIEELVELAHNGTSEKVKLEAIRELLNRTVGKVPDIVVGAQMEQPWENILADSLLPIPGDEPIDMSPDDGGTYRMVPYPEEDVPPSSSADPEVPRGGDIPISGVARGGGTKRQARLRKPKKVQDGDPSPVVD